MRYIQSVQNTQVKQWKKLLTKKERDKTNTYIIEGFHLVEEALKNKDEVLEIIVQEETQIPPNWDIEGLQVTEVTLEIAKQLADTETTQGVFAICKKKNVLLNHVSGKTFLLIDAVQDPGNIGTLIRTADAAGIDAVILGKGSADGYSPKVLRAAQGSHFHIDLLTGDLAKWIETLHLADVPVYGTALENGVPYLTVEPTAAFALLVGNEGNGVNKELLSLTKQNLYIPILGKSESLNVGIAAGILMYYFQLQGK
ncbi:TrmH family RNA methyltransferase [Heyndrickxia ginsengihumi]|uniref:RNA methyltransferase n=1 Tax=Heyndrickxia ginsengihumi TaxID=363870 RepID=A0A6M0P8J3_9BACI|nr:RNA methyltransferase [Heyndrickxia ginsengihumi]MBE6182711.1 RNA methyltransferase [Bacillus sp. (in: firmicutes)]MCM3021976.1 RNA methyltransferase [Heyndrickxia ginsengihumi]NEY20891.1 RNA methyltransferase [Heyndrickxia ginsengihumi]